MFKNLKLGSRLIASFLVMALIVGITGAVGFVSMNRVGDKIQNMLQNLASQQKLVLLMGVTQKACHVSLLQAAMVQTGIAKFEEYAEDYRMKNDLFKIQCDTILKGNKKLEIKAAPRGSDIEKRTKTALQQWAQFEEVAQELLTTKEKILKGSNPGANKQAAVIDEKLHDLAESKLVYANDKAKEAVDDLLVAVGGQIAQANREIGFIQRSAGLTFISVIIIAILLAVILGVIATKNMVNRITLMAQALNQGAEGNLATTLAIDSGDELGKLAGDFNTMVGKLSETINKVNTSAGELTHVSGDIDNASRQVTNSANLQADGVSKTSGAVSDITDSIKNVAQWVDNLSVSASDTSSSILEMAASVEEVASNVETLTLSVEEVSSSITEMAVSIREINKGVGTLLEAANTTASSIMEMDSSIKQVEKNAMETSAISEDVLLDAENGKNSVDATISGINEIRRSSRITSEVIENLSTKAEDIGSILSVIDDVAEQTNLLAFNAAIIAAQAGEHGRGFAIVADEIKELAERTSSSTREIAQVVRGVQDETCRAVEAINEAERCIADGEYLSQRSGEALNKIVAGVEKSAMRMAEIARATVEQSNGSQLISEAMEQVSEMVERIAKATREQGQGSELIMASVERMKDLTAQVRRSTRAQSKVGNSIAKSTENITGMIQRIKGACDEQNRGSEQIVVAINDIQHSTQLNLKATNVLDQSVKKLTDQAKVLHQEISIFRV
ncbi:MAG: methyl-accepting chemotaxis sensory [Geobacteraceae bacterium]|nr:MAG: methyl-accepting chemotaxis sensory [Geobacteraceae bacterium]